MRYASVDQNLTLGETMSRNLVRVACCALAPMIGALALWGTTAVAAAETPQWYEFVEGGKSPIKTAKEMKWTNGKIAIRDNKTGLYQVSCSDTGSGVVGPSGAGEITKWTISSCVTTEGTCHTPTVTAKFLPWTTQLSYVGSNIVNSFKAGRPELWVACEGKVGDECPVLEPRPTMSNLEKGVNELFTGEAFSCWLSNPKAGHIEGARTLELTNGRVLSVK